MISHLGATRQVGVVDELAHGLARLVGAPAAQVELARRVRHGRRAHLHGAARRVLDGPPCGSGSSWSSGDVHAHRAALHLGLAVGDLGDRAAHAECRRDAPGRRRRAARVWRTGASSASVERAWPARACALGRGAEPAVALAPRRARRRPSLGASRRARSSRRAARISSRSSSSSLRCAASSRSASTRRALALVGRRRPHGLGRGALRLARAAARSAQRVAASARSPSASRAQPHRAPLGARGLAQQPLGLERAPARGRARAPPDDARVEPEPLGDLQRVRRARAARASACRSARASRRRSRRRR